jgi:glycosyltransferase involved in cell wall biosynthesis
MFDDNSACDSGVTSNVNTHSASSVDVIVPCYRYGRFLRQCVESVLKQSLHEVRVLIIDDASPDDTAEVATDLAREDSRVTFCRHSINKGHINTYNEGIEWASGNYLLLLSADDYLLPGALKRAADLLDVHPEAGFTFGKTVDVKGDVVEKETIVNRAVESVVGDGASLVLSGECFFSIIESFRSLNIVRTPTAVVRTDLQKRLGGYRRELPHSGDLEMSLRLAAHASVGVLGAYQAACRFHADNMQRTYYDRYLPDLVQRKAAFDCIFESCSAVLKDSHQLHRRLLTPLAHDAIACAHRAFNEGELELARQLCVFAVNIHPGIRKSLPWVKLSCKQIIGLRVWRAVHPVVRRLLRQNSEHQSRSSSPALVD